MGHVQTIYNFESLDAPMTLNLNAIELYDGTVEATGSDLEYSIIRNKRRPYVY